MQRTELGKIEKLSFGFQRDYPFLLGLELTLSGRAWGVGTSYMVNTSPDCKWDSDDARLQAYYSVMRDIGDLLKEAKKDNITQLVGVPIEATFDGNRLVNWRVLTEVL